MKAELRITLLIILLAVVCQVCFGQEETHTFGYFQEDPQPDSIEGVVFRPDPEAGELFLLFLESSTDLETWRNEGLQSYQVQADGTVVVQGDDALDRKFWRMRILHPVSQEPDEWLALLQVHRGDDRVTAKLTVRTNFHPYVANYVENAVTGLPIPWEEAIENEEAVDAAVAAAVARIKEIVTEARPVQGDYFEVTRGIR
jgi:hypothetical protein